MPDNVKRSLFARSGNRCAFPGCDQKIVVADGTYVAELCHIEAAASGGERFNGDQSQEDRTSAENLILFCKFHHVITNDEKVFTPATLRQIKEDHERRVAIKLPAPSLSEHDWLRMSQAMNTQAALISKKISERTTEGLASLRQLGINVDSSPTSPNFFENFNAIGPMAERLAQHIVDTAKRENLNISEQTMIGLNTLKMIKQRLLNAEIAYLKISVRSSSAPSALEEERLRQCLIQIEHEVSSDHHFYD